MMKNKVVIFKEENVTVDQLAEMVQKGFVEARQDLLVETGKLGERIDSLEGRFDSMEQKMDKGFASLGKQIKALAK